MTDSKECLEVMKATPSNVQLLVDVGHLKVSAHTLGYDRISFLNDTSAWTTAFHISENNALEDENQSPNKDS